MNTQSTLPLLLSLDEIQPGHSASVGGKAANLAQLKQHGFHIPDGFVIPSDMLEDSAAIRAEVAGALARLSGSRDKSLFAVRSSGQVEDSAQASYAGEFESQLNVPADEVLNAAREVWSSQFGARAEAYADAQGLESRQGMHVLVQKMVPAEIAGVLFTADPITGSRDALVGNYVTGLGERLVSGEADPGVFRLARPRGKFSADQPGPADDRVRRAARALFRAGVEIEEHLNGPQDIEWAVAGGRLYILQARPITTMSGIDPQTGGQNDSLLGDYLWTSTNFGEALPDVMTPLTHSMMARYMEVNRIGLEKNWLPMGGSIGGRLYMNLTLPATLFRALGFSPARIRALVEDAFGELPEGVEIPVIPTGRWTAIRTFLPHAFRRARLINGLKAEIPAFIAGAPGRAERLQKSIEDCHDPAALLHLWQNELNPMLDQTMLMLAAGTSDYKKLSRGLRAELNERVGPGDANALLSGRSGADEIASLGPVLGLAGVAAGEISTADYLRAYGHRGPSEFELSKATPGESLVGLEAQLETVRDNPVDARALIKQKQAQHDEAWRRLEAVHPGKARKLDRRLAALHEASSTREAVRSEVVRLLRVLRPYALKAGELTGLGKDVFFLTLAEITAQLSGDRRSAGMIPPRKAQYEKYCALPSYPPLIRGRFHPQQWAEDPDRRMDIYTNGSSPAEVQDDRAGLHGFAGSPGVVEARVRVLADLSESSAFEPGEILVAHTTNIGWTPIFPRAAAIITDVGAPLSHAAIVARELGIPAVVGTGTATARLKTGDLVRVDGGGGRVTLLQVE